MSKRLSPPIASRWSRPLGTDAPLDDRRQCFLDELPTGVCPDEHPHRIAAFVALTHRPKQIQGRTEGFSRASTVPPSSIFFPFQINHFPAIACSKGLLC